METPDWEVPWHVMSQISHPWGQGLLLDASSMEGGPEEGWALTPVVKTKDARILDTHHIIPAALSSL